MFAVQSSPNNFVFGPGGHDGFLLEPENLGRVTRMLAFASGTGRRDRDRGGGPSDPKHKLA